MDYKDIKTCINNNDTKTIISNFSQIDIEETLYVLHCLDATLESWKEWHDARQVYKNSPDFSNFKRCTELVKKAATENGDVEWRGEFWFRKACSYLLAGV